MGLMGTAYKALKCRSCSCFGQSGSLWWKQNLLWMEWTTSHSPEPGVSSEDVGTGEEESAVGIWIVHGRWEN